MVYMDAVRRTSMEARYPRGITRATSKAVEIPPIFYGHRCPDIVGNGQGDRIGLCGRQEVARSEDINRNGEYQWRDNIVRRLPALPYRLLTYRPIGNGMGFFAYSMMDNLD
jgi:hypothetical protein